MDTISQCPVCTIMIEVYPLNCRIIRCGAKILPCGRLEQFPQHARREHIEALLLQPHVGCGTPLEYDTTEAIFKITGWDS